MVQQFDGVAKAILDPDSIVTEGVLARIAEAEHFLTERQFDLALNVLRSLDAADPQVASHLAYALYETHRHGEVVSLLVDRSIAGLQQEDVQHCIWSLCELRRFPQARDWLGHHGRFHTTSAKVFRRLVLQRFPELGQDTK